MVSGFFLGGLAQGLDTAQQNEFQSRTLQLAQQRQQMLQEQVDFSRYDNIRKDALNHLQDAIEKIKIANPDMQPQQIASSPAIQAWKQMLGETDKHLKQPGYSDSIITGFIATPSQTVTEKALAEARQPPLERQKVEAQIGELKARTDYYTGGTGGTTGGTPGNPDLDTNTQLGGPQISPQAKAIGEYRSPPLTASARNPAARRIMDEVFAHYPNYDAKNYKVEQAAATADVRADTNTLTQLTKSRESIQAFADTTIQNGEVLVDLAKKVDQTGRPVFERWLRAGRQAIQGDADVSNFNFQYNMWRTDAARVIQNPNLVGQLTDTAKAELTAATSPSANVAQIEGAVKLAKADADRRMKGLDAAIGRVKGRLQSASGKKSDSGDSTAPESGGVTVHGFTFTPSGQ